LKVVSLVRETTFLLINTIIRFIPEGKMRETEFDGERIKKYFRGNYSEEESDYLMRLFASRGDERRLRSHMSRQFDEINEEEGDSKNLEGVLYKIHYDINTSAASKKKSPVISIVRWSLQAAGALLIPLMIYIGIQSYRSNVIRREAWVEVNAPAWTRTQFSLPDGTTGWLNSSSSIKYRGDFLSKREVDLKGEAFFDVASDKHLPFIVRTQDINVKVLGTRFNIASYDNERSVEVVLEEGKLEFNNNDKSKSYTMRPNDLVVYDKDNDDYYTEVVQPQKYLSWTEGKLVFRNDPLDVIARRLERWYNIDVEVVGSANEGPRWRATFIDESLEEVLNLLKCSLPVDYSIEYQNQKPDDSFTKRKVILKLK